MNNKSVFRMTDMQLKAELDRCVFCEEKPCKEACPVDCSPADFIMAAKVAEPQDIQRSAAIIMKNNPLGGICGMVCPDRHCMAECSRKLFDGSIDIPALQAEIVARARDLGGIPEFVKIDSNGKKIAIIGAGPAGLGAAALLGQKGYEITLFEERDEAGGMCNLIPDYRLSRKMLKDDITRTKELGNIAIKRGTRIDRPKELLKDGYDAVIVATGLWKTILPGISNEDCAITAIDYLSSPIEYNFSGGVAVIGGGATALDCAITAKKNGAESVELFSLEKFSEMPLTEKERKEIFEYGVEVSGRTKVSSILVEDGKISGINTQKVFVGGGGEFNLKNIKDVFGTEQKRSDIKNVIIAIGHKSDISIQESEDIFYTGDVKTGPTTVVEAVAAGKNIADEVNNFIMKKPVVKIDKLTKSRLTLSGYRSIPVSLETDFFGRKISTPFILSAAPPTDGYEQMKKAYEAGWSGGIMKTSFAAGPIHIPADYMHVFNDTTYGNCDNVSGHLLDRVCGEIEKLVKEYPNKLTIGSTGGPVTGNDAEDKAGWQSNTKTLENAGAMGIEYSLSCPQGGEGTEGDIVSQSASLTAKVIDWIMEAGNPNIPKLFKLTAAVTSIEAIMLAIKEVLDKYPQKKAGVTLANTFPVMDFQSHDKNNWQNGVVFGMSGEAVAPISYFTLARAVPVGVVISGNGGPMNYKQAAHFLALGVKTVQFCTIAMKYGYGIFDELTCGLSHLMKQRGINSIKELIGIAQPDPICDFMDLSPLKKISSLIDEELCVSCGNCTRCPYLAIELDDDKPSPSARGVDKPSPSARGVDKPSLSVRGVDKPSPSTEERTEGRGKLPKIDPSKCIGCSICTKRCFTGSLEMRDRTLEETAELKED